MFEKATTLDPEYAAAWSALGGVYQLKGGFLGMPELAVKAVEYLRRALNLKPSLVQAHTWLGAALVMLGRINEAVAAMQEALRLEPDNADAHVALGRAFWIGKGDVPLAIEHLRQGIMLNPESGYAYLQLSFLESLNGELDAAAESARNAIALQERAISGTEGLLIVGAHTRLVLEAASARELAQAPAGRGIRGNREVPPARNRGFPAVPRQGEA